MANEFESALEGMGFSFADNPEDLETKNEQPTETQDTEAVAEEETEAVDTSDEVKTVEEIQSEQSDDVLSFEGNNEESDTEVSDSFEAADTEVEDILSDEEYESTVLSAVSEMLGAEFNSVEDLRGLLNKEEQTATSELDPEVQAIADFVRETGRSVNDWFSYQSFNPSEMDDATVMKTALMQQNPDLSEEDVQLLLADKYKMDEDMYSENEMRIGKLNLKMDAQNARNELNQVREQFKAPVRQEAAQVEQDIESPITEEWVNAMSSNVNEMESLELELGKDKSFSFGLTDEYKQTLIDKNSKLDEFFDPYVDENGNWDFDTLSAHRAVIDNIDAIAKAIYAQGLSDGQSEVVKQTVNPSAPNAKGASVDAPSAQDKVRQQVLDALRGGDDTLRFKF